MDVLSPEMLICGKHWTNTQLRQAIAAVRNGYAVARVHALFAVFTYIMRVLDSQKMTITVTYALLENNYRIFTYFK